MNDGFAATTHARSRALTGILMMLAAMAILPAMDGAAKLMGDHIPAVQLAWARYTFQLAVSTPYALWILGPGAFRSRRPVLQTLRGLILVTGTALFFASIALIPLADALAVFFISPFIVTALSPLVLGEHVGPWRWGAVVAGFIGALIVIRPGAGVIQPGVLIAVGAGFAYAAYALVTRKLAGADPPLVTLTLTGLIGTLVSSAVVPFVWVPPTALDWGLMLLMGVVAAIGHLLIIMAYERAGASQLAPFSYSEIVAATLIGYVLFGDFPLPLTWLGIAVIVASGIVIAWREGVRRSPRPEATVPGPSP